MTGDYDADHVPVLYHELVDNAINKRIHHVMQQLFEWLLHYMTTVIHHPLSPVSG